MTTIPLSPRPPRRRNESRDIVRPIEVALNKLPGVKVTRNPVGLVVSWHRRNDPTAHPFQAGLGLGSADIVGIVSVLGHLYPYWPMVPQSDPLQTQMMTIARVFALEVKRDAEASRKSRSERRATTIQDQARWGLAVRRMGAFYCVVHGVAEAVAAVERCRHGRSE